MAQSSCKQTIFVSDVLEIVFIDSLPSVNQEVQSDEEIWRNYLTDVASNFNPEPLLTSKIQEAATQCHRVMLTQKGDVVHAECSLITYLHTLFDSNPMPQTEIYIATSKFPCQGCWLFKEAYDGYQQRSFCPRLRGQRARRSCYTRREHPLWTMPNVENMKGLEEIFGQLLERTLGKLVVLAEPFREDSD